MNGELMREIYPALRGSDAHCIVVSKEGDFTWDTNMTVEELEDVIYVILGHIQDKNL